MTRERKSFSSEFKLQMVRFHSQALGKWIKQHQNTGTFNHQDNLSDDEKELNHAFNRQQPMETLVSDLTYVKVAGTWHYMCLFIDLFNREIVGYSAGKNKDANLVSKAISRINHNLEQIKLFHTDRGKEFENHLIDEVLETFKIKRSLSTKGCPYDNAVAEATMKAMKIEFVKQMQFENLEQLETELFDYVNWYNNFRLNSSLQYLTAVAFKNLHMKTV